MAAVHHFLLGTVVMVMMSLSAVHSHECDCSKYTKGGDGCDQYTAAVQKCIEPNAELPPGVDIPAMCRIYNETVTCMATIPKCDNPPADSKTWTTIWTEMNNLAGPLCSHSPDDTSCGNFESQAFTCVEPLMNGTPPGPGSDTEKLCRVYKEVKSCMDPLISRCPAEAQTSSINQGWQRMLQHVERIPC